MPDVSDGYFTKLLCKKKDDYSIRIESKRSKKEQSEKN